MARLSIFPALAVLCLACCGSSTATGPASGPATRPALQAISYHRTGGFAGTNDTIAISPDGRLTTAGRLVGRNQAQLSPQQMQDLADAFAGWDRLEDRYEGRAADTFDYEIQYGQKTARVTRTPLGDLPDQLQRAITALENLARTAD